MQNVYILLVLIFLSACGLIPARPTEPALQITPIFSATPTVFPSTTPTPATPTVSPTSTPDPRYFRDDFNGILDAGWSWVREDPLNWSLTALPGSLQINVAGGYVVAGTNPNLLLRPAPEGNFQIETQITFRPTRNYQFAGLIIYENDDNFLQAGRSACNSIGCVGTGLYMDYYENGVIVKPDFGQPFGDIDPLLLRLSRRENTYTFEASTDGKIWFIIGSHTSDMNPLQIGLVTGQRMRGENLPATFEYFEVRSLQ
jgi:beta-xylosidase